MDRIHRVIPWGRSFDEYIGMFALSEEELRRPILGCGDGPASFAAELTARGGVAVSADPIYRFSAEEIHQRILEVYPLVLEEARSRAHQFVWTSIPSVEELGRARMAAMSRFVADFTARRSRGGYVAAALPDLPFASGSFGLWPSARIFSSSTASSSTRSSTFARSRRCAGSRARRASSRCST